MEIADLTEAEKARLVRQSLVDMLGELPAITTIAYAGDGGDNFGGFAGRLLELYGPSCTRIFGFILERVRLNATAAESIQDRHTGDGKK